MYSDAEIQENDVWIFSQAKHVLYSNLHTLTQIISNLHLFASELHTVDFCSATAKENSAQNLVQLSVPFLF